MPSVDDELERLAAYVERHFGERELKAAGWRAMAALTAADLAVDAAAEDDDVIAGPNGELYDIRSYRDAFVRQLRRLVQPQ